MAGVPRSRSERARTAKRSKASGAYLAARPGEGSAAEAHLRGRGWRGPFPAFVRYAPTMKNPAEPGAAPASAAVVPFLDAGGQVVAILAAFFEVEGVILYRDLLGADADAVTRPADRFKFPDCFLGSYAGAFGHLDRAGEVLAVALTLGDAIAFRAGRDDAVPVWLAGDERNVARLDVPAVVRSLIFVGEARQGYGELRERTLKRDLEMTFADVGAPAPVAGWDLET